MSGEKMPSKVNFRRLAVLTLVFVVSVLPCRACWPVRDGFLRDQIYHLLLPPGQYFSHGPSESFAEM